MTDLVYVQVFLGEGKVNAWSSGRGRLEARTGPWTDMFRWVRAREPQAKVMIHLIGDDESVDDASRIELMGKARDSGFSVVRLETGAPMDPEEAFQLMLIPFT